jgi:uncharacterized membrane protein
MLTRVRPWFAVFAVGIASGDTLYMQMAHAHAQLDVDLISASYIALSAIDPAVTPTQSVGVSR